MRKEGVWGWEAGVETVFGLAQGVHRAGVNRAGVDRAVSMAAKVNRLQAEAEEPQL
jgi:hypothetical protein